jgi:hypothetical protein
MWKTPGYQQVFRFFPFCLESLHRMHIPMYNQKNPSLNSMLRYRTAAASFRKKTAQKLNPQTIAPSNFVAPFP